MVRNNAIGMSALLLLFAGIAHAQVTARFPPIKKLTDARPNASVFRAASRNKPLILRSEKDASDYFGKADLAKLMKQVDFRQQFILVFAWRGSGQDRLEHSVLESYPEQIVFLLKPGRTRDLRPHIQVYAMRSNVKWRTGATGMVVPEKEMVEYIKVEVKGKLNSRVLAIGGETTGVTISANAINWELDFGQEEGARRRADALDGKTVIVTGQLNAKRGVEIQQRWIVTVESLKAADRTRNRKVSGEAAYLTPAGSLRQTLLFKDSQSGFAGESGHILTLETNGNWRRQTFLNQNVRDAEQEGKLSSKQLQELGRELAKYDLLGLPEQTGKDPGVNPHVFSIAFGEKHCALILTGGAMPPEPDPDNMETPIQRMSSLVRVLQRHLKNKKPGR